MQPCDHLRDLACCASLCFCHFPLWCPGSGVESIPDLCLLLNLVPIASASSEGSGEPALMR